MEAVRAFNNELSGLYEAKPPVSRAKMAQLTKCAIKAIKFYKHVVQSVEKFIQKCKSEYKVPGLYVIDSIVRQSRHQFGAEKDVFAPRFTKNVVLTFQNLFKCPPDERSKVVRVLNLWQKNAVFPVEVIQPLLDLAADPTNPQLIASAQRAVDSLVSVNQKPGNATNQFPGEHHSHEAVAQVRHEKELPSANPLLEAQNDMLDTVKQLLQQTQKQPTSLSAQQQQLQQLQLLQQQLLQQTELMQQPAQQQQAAAIIDSNLLSQIQTLTNQLLNNQIKTLHSKPPEPGFNKKLLDFDYGESDEEEEKHDDNSESIPGNVQNILNDPTIMQQIHQMSQTIKKTEQLKNELNMQEKIRQQLLKQQEKEFNQQISQEPPPQIQHHIPVAPQMPPQPPPPSQIIQNQPPPMHPPMPYFVAEPPYPAPTNQNDLSERMDLDNRHDNRHYVEMPNADVIVIDDQPDIHKSSRSRDRSRSRSPRRKKRSRSRSRERRRRSRSRDRDRDRDRSDRERDRDRRKRSRSRERERERQREKERERRRKGLPSIKERHLSVCTRTIWLGHIAKVTSEDELRQEIEKYGAVETINMIPPRGCAFVCMARRKDAPKAVEKLKGVKIHSNQLKVAWAPGMGVKDAEYKDMWDSELGVTYIPWDKLPQDLTHLMEGGMIDEDTIPEHLRGDLQLDKSDAANTNNIEEPQQNFKMNEVTISNPPIAVPPPAAIPPQQPPLQGQPMPRMLMQIPPPPTGMMPPMMMPLAPGMARPPTTGVPPPPLGMAPASTTSAVLAPRPVPPVPTATGVSISLPTMAPAVVLTTVASNNPAMPSLPPPGLVQLPQGLQNNLSSSILAAGGISVPPRPPPNFAAQLRQQPRPFPPQPFPGGPAFRLQVPAPAQDGARALANVRPPLDAAAALVAVQQQQQQQQQQDSKDNSSEAGQEDWLKRNAEAGGEDGDADSKTDSTTPQTIDAATSEMLQQAPAGAMPAISVTLQQMLAQRPPPNPAVGMRPPLPPTMGPRPGINGPPTELRLGGPNGPLLTGPPNRATAIGIPGMPAGIAIGPRTISVDGPPPGFPAGRMGLPGGPRFTPRFPPVFPGGPPPRFQGPMGTMLRPPRPDADGRFPANTFPNNGTFDRASFERAIRPFGPIGPRPDRPANERWMGRDRWAPREAGPGMRFRREFDQRDEFFDRSRYVLDNRDPDRNTGGRRMSRFDGEDEHEGDRPPHHYEDDRSLHDDESGHRGGDDRDRSRRGGGGGGDDERDRLRHGEDRDRLRRPDDRDRSRHDDDRNNRLRYEGRDRFRFGENGREGPDGVRPRNREDRPRKSRWSDANDKTVEAPSLDAINTFEPIPENSNPAAAAAATGPPPPPIQTGPPPPDAGNQGEVAMDISDNAGSATPTQEELEDGGNGGQVARYPGRDDFSGPGAMVGDKFPSASEDTVRGGGDGGGGGGGGKHPPLSGSSPPPPRAPDDGSSCGRPPMDQCISQGADVDDNNNNNSNNNDNNNNTIMDADNNNYNNNNNNNYFSNNANNNNNNNNNDSNNNNSNNTDDGNNVTEIESHPPNFADNSPPVPDKFSEPTESFAPLPSAASVDFTPMREDSPPPRGGTAMGLDAADASPVQDEIPLVAMADDPVERVAEASSLPTPQPHNDEGEDEGTAVCDDD